MGRPLAELRPIGVTHTEKRNSKLRRNELGQGINRMNFKGPLIAHRFNSFIKLNCSFQQRVSNGARPN